MKRFQFSLEHLLRLRKLEVAKCQEELEGVHQEYIFLKNEIRFLEKENHFYTQKFIANTLSQQEKSFVPHYLFELSEVIKMYTRKIDGLEKNIQEKREKLLDAVKERKKIEKLKEKQYAQWQHQEKQREDHHLDEILPSRRKN